MTNSEKYKQAFSVIRFSGDISPDAGKAAVAERKNKLYRIAIGFAVFMLLLCGSVTAYATDFGGIRHTIRLWIDGDLTDATINFTSDGTYRIKYFDSNGVEQHQGGGGIAIGRDGSERPLTRAELMKGLNDPKVMFNNDGSVWIYYFDQKINITDKFHDNICYIRISHGNETLYMTIKDNGSYSFSADDYPSPFNFD